MKRIKRVVFKPINEIHPEFYQKSQKRKRLYKAASTIFIGGHAAHGFHVGRKLSTVIPDIEKRYPYADIPDHVKKMAKSNTTISNKAGAIYGVLRGFSAHKNSQEYTNTANKLDDFYAQQRSRGVSKKVALKKTGKEAAFHIGKIIISKKVGNITAKATLKGIHHTGLKNPLASSIIGLVAYKLGYGVAWKGIDKVRSSIRKVRNEYIKHRLEENSKIESFKQGFHVLVRRS